MAVPEPGSRSVIRMTPTPSAIIDCACDCIVVALPLALSIVQSSLYLVH